MFKSVLPSYLHKIDPKFNYVRFLEGTEEGEGSGGDGGSGTEGLEGAGGDGSGADGAGAGGEGNEPDPDGTDALGDPGKKALDTMKARLKAETQKRRDAEAKLAAANAPKPGDELTPEQIREQVRAELAAELREPMFRTTAQAAAQSLGFNDPKDALLYLDASEFEAGDDGSFDASDISEKLSELLAAKPWLAKTPVGQSGAGQGGRKVPPAPAGQPPKPLTLDQRIAQAREKGDFMLELSLQNQKLANAG